MSVGRNVSFQLSISLGISSQIQRCKNTAAKIDGSFKTQLLLYFSSQDTSYHSWPGNKSCPPPNPINNDHNAAMRLNPSLIPMLRFYTALLWLTCCVSAQRLRFNPTKSWSLLVYMPCTGRKMQCHFLRHAFNGMVPKYPLVASPRKYH